jgi:hypothetical protein
MDDDTRAAALATVRPRRSDAAAPHDDSCAPALTKCALTLLTISNVAVLAEAPIAAIADKLALTRTAESVARLPTTWLPLAKNPTMNILLADNAPVMATATFDRLLPTATTPAKTE